MLCWLIFTALSALRQAYGTNRGEIHIVEHIKCVECKRLVYKWINLVWFWLYLVLIVIWFHVEKSDFRGLLIEE